MVLQQLCPKGQMKQQKCARGQDGTILATVKVETPCNVCPSRVRLMWWANRRTCTNLENSEAIWQPGKSERHKERLLIQEPEEMRGAVRF
jgi:hypothetical protein